VDRPNWLASAASVLRTESYPSRILVVYWLVDSECETIDRLTIIRKATMLNAERFQASLECLEDSIPGKY
jgi:hypothetical protein